MRLCSRKRPHPCLDHTHQSISQVCRRGFESQVAEISQWLQVIWHAAVSNRLTRSLARTCSLPLFLLKPMGIRTQGLLYRTSPQGRTCVSHSQPFHKPCLQLCHPTQASAERNKMLVFRWGLCAQAPARPTSFHASRLALLPSGRKGGGGGRSLQAQGKECAGQVWAGCQSLQAGPQAFPNDVSASNLH